MNPNRMTARLLTALLLAAASITAIPLAPAQAGPAPSGAGVAVGSLRTEEPAQPPAPVGPPASPAPAVEQTGGAPTSAHTFETPPFQGNKGSTPRSAATESFSLARAGAIKVRLVTVQLTDRKADIPMDSAIAAVQATSAYWEKMSNGRLSVSVASTETHNSRSASSGQRYSDMMNTIAGELGWVPSPYTALVVFVSSPTLSDGAYGAGWSYNGTSGRVIMPLPAALTKSVLAHEFGHVLGLMHADSLECGSGAQDVATKPDGSFADSTCRIREYGDTLDLMGASHAGLPAISSTLWEFGGFGTGREVRNVGKADATRSYTLTAWAGNADNRALKFTDPASGETYYLELRLPVGYDTSTAVNGNRGVKIVQQFGAGSLVLMPSTLRFAGYYSSRHAWQAGQTFTTHAGTRVSIDWISDSAAGVTIGSTPSAASQAIAAVESSSSAALGARTSAVVCGLRDGGCFQGFQNGVVMWSPATGAHPSLTGPVRDAWARSGYEAGTLGYPASGLICGLKNGGCFQNYQHGSIIWSPSSGAALSTFGAIRDLWAQQNFENGPLGYPVSNAVCGLRNGGCFQNYQGGTVAWSPATGAHTIVPGPVQQLWQRTGYENGTLGYPTGKQSCNTGATECTQAFQSGTAAWSGANGGWVIPGASSAAWKPAELGYPAAAQVCGLRAGGCFQNFQKGVIMSVPGSGTFALSGQVLREWQQTGFENGSLGYPVSALVCGLKNGGCFQNFENASILSSPATGTHPVYLGPFHSTWSGSGFENGTLGYPVSHQICGLRNGGCFQNYQGGTVMWSPGTGAHPITSAPIRNAWSTSGFENGTLGYPTSSIICGLKNGGCFQNFEKGSVLWSSTSGAAPVLLGPIHTAWGQQGFENGRLGYPAGPQTCTTATSCTQTFQGGKITWTPTLGARTGFI